MVDLSFPKIDNFIGPVVKEILFDRQTYILPLYMKQPLMFCKRKFLIKINHFYGLLNIFSRLIYVYSTVLYTKGFDKEEKSEKNIAARGGEGR